MRSFTECRRPRPRRRRACSCTAAVKSRTSCRSLVGVIEPTVVSHRPFQLPAVMTSHAGVCQSTSTPSRLAISVATSMSKPSYSPVCSLSEDCGGYAGSVETVSSPASQTSASRSVASVQDLRPRRPSVSSPPAGSSVAVELSSPPQAASGTISARSAAASSGRVRGRMHGSPRDERCVQYARWMPPDPWVSYAGAAEDGLRERDAVRDLHRRRRHAGPHDRARRRPRPSGSGPPSRSPRRPRRSASTSSPRASTTTRRSCRRRRPRCSATSPRRPSD